VTPQQDNQERRCAICQKAAESGRKYCVSHTTITIGRESFDGLVAERNTLLAKLEQNVRDSQDLWERGRAGR